MLPNCKVDVVPALWLLGLSQKRKDLLLGENPKGGQMRRENKNKTITFKSFWHALRHFYATDDLRPFGWEELGVGGALGEEMEYVTTWLAVNGLLSLLEEYLHHACRNGWDYEGTRLFQGVSAIAELKEQLDDARDYLLELAQTEGGEKQSDMSLS